MPYPGEMLAGTYQIVDEIGKGGAGIIYRAYHRNLQKYVVVKKIKDNFVGVLNARGEVDILKSLHHTALPQVYDFIQLGSEVYTVMDYIDGYDLKHYIDEGCRFDEAMLWSWLLQLCEVLDYLHKHGVLHLDIKPANIMLDREGRLFLIDFNISLSGDENGMNGISQIYASPEQYRKWKGILYGTGDGGVKLDARTDIYSLGASFYHMMTGLPPSPDQTAIYPLSCFEQNYSKELLRIVGHMMEPERRKRFPSAERVILAIRRIQRSRAEKKTLRMVFGIMLSAILLLGITTGVVMYRNHWQAGPEERQLVGDEEARLAEWNERGEFELAYRDGVDFLNSNGELLNQMPGARQSLLEQLLESCMGMEDYSAAERYAEELLEIEEKPEYFQSAAVIAAYQGDYAAAEQYIQSAEQHGGDREELEKSRAELYAAQGAYGDAIAIYRELYSSNRDADTLRRMGVLNLRAGMEPDISPTEAASYLSEAVSCYEELDEVGLSTYADQKNLVTAYIQCGWTQKAISLLQSMCVNYPKQYTVYRDLGVLLYNEEMKKAFSARDFSAVKRYVIQAERLYEEMGETEEDEQLNDLQEIVEQLP